MIARISEKFLELDNTHAIPGLGPGHILLPNHLYRKTLQSGEKIGDFQGSSARLPDCMRLLFPGSSPFRSRQLEIASHDSTHGGDREMNPMNSQATRCLLPFTDGQRRLPGQRQLRCHIRRLG